MLLHIVAFTQESDTLSKLQDLNEIVISGNKFGEKKRNVIQKIDVITSKYISKVNAQNTGDLLMSTGNVFVQKSQQGGSSPVIRGFEASRVLLVIDGIRMNNAIYRSGHLQNIITVDQNQLERIEIMYGPSSTLYGSDALGGTIHMITRQPKLSENGNRFTAVNTMSRYSTANNEKSGNFSLNLGYQKWAFLTHATFSDFGDMRSGANRTEAYPEFGARNQYIVPINHSFVDSIVTNTNNLIQKFSGYKQWDIMQKILFKPNEKISHLLNIQLSNSTNVPRYDRLTDVRNGNLRFAEWYYGPQKRDLYAYTMQAEKVTSFIDQFKTTFSFQQIEESRNTREYRRYDRFDSRVEHVKVWGIVSDIRKVINEHEINAGIDLQWNDVHSKAKRTNLITGAISALDSRYPNGNNNMNYYAAFAQHIFKFNGNKWVLNDGVRLQFTRLYSSISDNSFFQLPVTEVTQKSSSLTGNVGIAYIPEEKTKISLGFASGFRAPNIDDLSKIFESSSAARQVTIPNPNLKPEFTYNADLSIRHQIGASWLIEATSYYTLFRNAIIKAPLTLNGNDSIIYYGNLSQVVASQNMARASLYGFSISISGNITKYLKIHSTLNYSKGFFRTDDSKPTSIYEKQTDGSYSLVRKIVERKPLDHIPPIYGKTSILYQKKSLSLEFFMLYNGAKKLDQYNPDGEDNQQYATPVGSLAWITFNFRSQFNITKELVAQLALENIFDKHYRTFASGFSAAGRNLVLTLRTNL